MKKQWGLYGLGLSFFLTLSLLAQERIIHTPPDQARAGQDLKLECSFESPMTTIRLARVYYRESEREEYKFVFLQELDNTWRTTIPGADVKGNILQYFIAFRLENDRLVTFPDQGEHFQPEEILVRAAATNVLAEPISTGNADVPPLLILSPESDEILQPRQVVIAVALSPDKIDGKSLTLTLNDRDATSFAVRSDYVLTYEPKNLSSGAHRLIIAANDKQGDPVQPIRLLFYIQGADEKVAPRAQFTGRAFGEGRYENIYNQNESFAMGGAEFNGHYGELEVRGRVFVTSLEDGGSQTRHRFSLGVEHEHFFVQAGDVYPRFNNLMMWGKRVRGLFGGVSAGAFRLETVFGQTYRAVEGSMDENMSLTHQGTFSQNLLGIRPSLNFRAVRFGVSFLKIKDDQNSVLYATRPKDNVVLGPDFTLTLDKGRLELRAQAAYSLLTLDTSIGAFSKSDIEGMFSGSVDVPIDPAKYKDLLIINDTTVPLNPKELTSIAYDVNFKANYYRNLVRFGYKNIGSDYYSLANSWLRKDIRGFYLSDRVRLFRNMFYVTAGLERYTDNFSQQGTKPSTNLNSVNVALSYYPGHGLPNVSVNFRNYSRINGITDVQIDSLQFSGEVDTTDMREDSRQRDINIQLGYQIKFKNSDHYFTLGYVAAIKEDNFQTLRLPGFFSQEMTSNVNMLTWSSTYQFPLRTAFSISTNKNVLGSGLSDFSYAALSLFGEYSFFNNKLSTFGEFRYTKTDGLTYSGAQIDVKRNHIRAGTALYLMAQQTVTLEMYYITFSSADASSLGHSPYADSIVRLRYEKLF